MYYEYSAEDTNSNEHVQVIQCYCEGQCPFGDDKGICDIVTPGGKCFASVRTGVDEDGYEYPVVSYGCLPDGGMALLQCKGSLVPHAENKSIQCCDEEDFCNRMLYSTYHTEAPLSFRQKLPYISLASSVSVCLAIFFVVALVVYAKYHKKRRKRNETNGNASEENNDNNGIRNNGIDIPEIETVTNLKQLIEVSIGSGSGIPIMVQRTISKQIEMERSIGKGRFGEVWLAKWRGEKIAAKIFFPTEEQSWFRETEVYQMVLMRHDNILGFIAADIKGTGSRTQMLLITDYHDNGSVFDFLQSHTLNPSSLLVMSKSIAGGLTHLHTEIFGVYGKASIAHRDINSKTILVKNNGECCISDFGLAVKFSSNSNVADIPPTSKNGAKRYMAPEILDKSINLNNFDSYKMTDMYSFGLVLWEMSRRCVIDGHQPFEYQVPFQILLPNDPSLEEMEEIVCRQKIRPAIPEIWNSVDILKIIAKAMQEMWHENPAVRLTALRVKKTFNKFESVEDVTIDMT